MSAPDANLRLSTALARIDAANAEDPHQELVGGRPEPKELVYARRMSAWLQRIEPAASDELQLAVRAQHLCRWRLPRTRFPEGRSGYLAWRRACQDLHGTLAAEILLGVGYDDATIARVGDLIHKRRLKADSEAQILEDAACLVFLESAFADFASKHESDKLIEILRKTWRKMSPRARELAATIELTPELAALVASATSATPAT